MSPLDLLIQEHNLIAKLITIVKNKLPEIKEQKANACFVQKLIDFFITYGDKTHHGKEEDILFREVGQKNLSDDLRTTLAELLEEHIEAREKLKKLEDANNRYSKGDETAYDKIIKLFEDLVVFYPAHIDKENNHFFKPAMEYFNEQELELMTKEFAEFDRSIIHEKYKTVVEAMGS